MNFFCKGCLLTASVHYISEKNKVQTPGCESKFSGVNSRNFNIQEEYITFWNSSEFINPIFTIIGH